MGKSAQIIGRAGEEIIAKHLLNKGFKIIKRNYRCKCGEIDIIAENKEYIVFTEVKTRGKNSFAAPSAFVTAAKQRKILKTAAYYLMTNPSALQPRFDIGEVLYSDGKAEVNYIENAFIQGGDYAPF